MGRVHSEETKQKIALAHTGKKRPPFSEEWRQRMSEAQKNRPPVSEETRRKRSLAMKGKNLKNGDLPYHSLHTWVTREKGKATFCEIANETCKGRFEWANLSHEYKRDLNDFISLCVSHHVRYDLKRKPDEDVKELIGGLRT